MTQDDDWRKDLHVCPQCGLRFMEPPKDQPAPLHAAQQEDAEGSDASIGLRAAPAAPKIPDFIRRDLVRACDEALHPKGMSTHDGKARVQADHVLRLIAMYDALSRGEDGGTK